MQASTACSGVTVIGHGGALTMVAVIDPFPSPATIDLPSACIVTSKEGRVTELVVHTVRPDAGYGSA